MRAAAYSSFVLANARLNERITSVLESEAGVELDAYEVIAVLDSEPGARMRLNELAQRIVLSKSGLTRRLDKLEKAGLIRREGCAEDRRGSFAVLTDKGRWASESALPRYQEAIRAHFGDRMTEGEARQLCALMKRVLESLEKCPA